MSLPTRAVVIQCTNRRSSPDWYSRSAWSAMSLGDRSAVGWPSRSRMNPAPRWPSGVVRGWTNNGTGSVHGTARRNKPSGSPFTDVAGPTGITPRRWVGSTSSSSCSSNRWPSDGTSNSAAPSPTTSSMREGRDRSELGFVTVIWPADRRPDHDSLRLDLDLDLERRGPEHERNRDRKTDAGNGGDPHELVPTEPPSDDPGPNGNVTATQPAGVTTPAVDRKRWMSVTRVISSGAARREGRVALAGPGSGTVRRDDPSASGALAAGLVDGQCQAAR